MEIENKLNQFACAEDAKMSHDLCIELHRKLKTRQIPLDEFLKEISYVALRYGFDELIPRQYPREPQELVEYNQLSKYQKGQMNNDFWWQDSIRNYLDVKSQVTAHNHGVLCWLKEISTYIPQEDFLSQGKIKNRLHEFKDPMADKLIETFGGEQV